MHPASKVESNKKSSHMGKGSHMRRERKLFHGSITEKAVRSNRTGSRTFGKYGVWLDNACQCCNATASQQRRCQHEPVSFSQAQIRVSSAAIRLHLVEDTSLSVVLWHW